MRSVLQRVANRLRKTVIWNRDGSPYLSRYYLLGGPRDTGDEAGGGLLNIMLHRFHSGDDRGDLHNHPWRWSVSLILAGGYCEDRRQPDDTITRRELAPGMLNILWAGTFHRVDLRDGDCWSLFVAGPKVGAWGFWNPAMGYVPWRKFLGIEKAA